LLQIVPQMMKIKSLVFLWLSMAAVLRASAVIYTFDPGDHLQVVLNMNDYTDHQINIYHDSPQAHYMTWRIVDNTCPTGWDMALCDWQHCFTSLVNTNDMDSVSTGNAGLIKITVNPFGIAGSGSIHFWVFPTGMMDQYTDFFFDFETIIANVGSVVDNSNSIIWNNALSEFQFKNAPQGIWKCFSLSGQMLGEFYIRSQYQIVSITDKRRGIYFLVSPQRKTYKFLIQ
jgi:hypothetical protein